MMAMAKMPGRCVRVICKTVFCKGAATWPAGIRRQGGFTGLRAALQVIPSGHIR